jgi:hypothetical protein
MGTCEVGMHTQDRCKEEPVKIVMCTIGDTTYGNVCCDSHMKEMVEEYTQEFGKEPKVVDIEE